MSNKPALSIVSTLYRSAENLAEFLERSVTAARSLVGDDFEIVLVNDGSPDDSFLRAAAMGANIPELILVDLSRNFGHHVALLEGLRQSQGELVFLIDSDLEESPEWLSEFNLKRLEEVADVVYGYQEERKGGLAERVSGHLYWGVFRWLSDLDLPPNVITCRLMTRRYVEAVMLYSEREVSIGGIFSVAGFRQVAIPVAKGHKGESSYSFRLKLWHLVNSISSFSTKPLTAIFLIGVAVFAVGIALFLYLIAASIFWNRPPVGWTSVIASVWLLGGLMMCGLGITAIYLGKIFSEVKGRPRTIVRSVVRLSSGTE